MDNVTKKLFLLSHCKALSTSVLYKLIKVDPTLELFHELKDSEWKLYFNYDRQRVQIIMEEFYSLEFDVLLKSYQRQNIGFLSIFDKSYPYLLLEIPDPPPFLYYQGDQDLLKSKYSISVVGTRYPTNYGKLALEKIIRPLITNNWLIISGLARGIDTLAHETALNNNGKTIAVIAGGLFHLYPNINKALAKRLLTTNLILSEHPPTTKPQKWHFPMRNRIISGLSLGTIVIQAKKKSGSLITAKHAIEQNREVFAVPGSILEESSCGTNELIQNGAKLIQNASNILEEFPFLHNTIFK